MEHIRRIAPLIERVFGWDEANFLVTFRNHSRYFLLTATVDGQAVGFKLGYELDSEEFYSWLGGVDPEYRKFGIASLLMEEQHKWAKDNSYKFVQTKTKNKFRDMLRLNIKHGFDVVGCHASSVDKDLKIVLRKKLTD
jgi:GNAT superfamily N-acetyltransferase